MIFDIIATPLFIIVLFFCIQVFLGLCRLFFNRHSEAVPPHPPAQSRISSVILIPAHNEEAVIAKTLSSLGSDIEASDSLLVIADNCTDNTADIVKSFGCRCVARTDESKRGKGYALAFGLDQVQALAIQPDVIIIVDADCEVSPGTIQKLKESAWHGQAPVQATYFLYLSHAATAKEKISEWAIAIKNIIRPAGLALLGGGVPISGSGFAAPTSFFRSVNLSSSEIVEDMKLGVDWLLAGHPTRFLSDASVFSPLPSNTHSAATQRQRWEQGHVGVIRRYAMPLLFAAISKRRLDLLLSAIDLCIPPLTVLLVLYATTTAILLLFHSFWSWAFLVLGALLLTLLVISNFIARLFSPPYLNKQHWSLNDLVGFFDYCQSKFALYFNIFKKPNLEWVKTAREDKNTPTQATQENKNDSSL